MPIASLIVRIGADMADLVSESKKATQSLSGIEKSVKQVGDAMKAYLSAQFLMGLVDATVSFASALSDMADKTGIGVTALQEFSYAGKMVGVSLDQITGAVGQMQDRLAGGDKGAAAALKEIGVSIADLRTMDPAEMFRTIAREMAKIEDPAKQVALMKDVFGKQGADLIPFVKHMDELTAKARELGLVMDEQTVSALDDFGDSVDTVKTLGLALVAQVLKPLIPLLTELSQVAMTAAGNFGKSWTEGISTFQSAFLTMVQNYARGMAAMRQFNADYLSWGQHSKDMQAEADYWKYIADHIKDAGANQTNVANETKRTGVNAGEWKDSTEEADRILKEALAHQKEIADVLDKMWGNDVIEKFQNQLEAIDVAGGKMSTLKSAQLDLINGALDYYRVWKETGRAVDDMTLKAREVLKLTPEGLLSSKSRGSTAGNIDLAPSYDQTNKELETYLTLKQSQAEIDEQGVARTQAIEQENIAYIDSLGQAASATDALTDANGRNARSMRDLSGQTQQGIATLHEWTTAIDQMWRAAGESEFGVMGAFTGMTQSGVGQRWTPRGYATGTDGYEYFGTGTPVVLHGWEKVTPKGAESGGGPAIAVNLSGVMLSNNPAARDEVARYINDTIAHTIKRSRKFSY